MYHKYNHASEMEDFEPLQFHKDNGKNNELHTHQDHIEFMYFWFYPTIENKLIRAKIDEKPQNPEKELEELLDIAEADILSLNSGFSKENELDDITPREQDDFYFIKDTTIASDTKTECRARIPCTAANFQSSLPSSSLLQTNTPSKIKVIESPKFKPFQEDKWNKHFKEFVHFVKENGHGAVPHCYPKSPLLTRWVKRQRSQYKLRQDQKPSTMTEERISLLSSVGFIWDKHEVNWREKINALKQFRSKHGHCNVPTKYKDRSLGTWVKCQRRQYKLFWEGKISSMNPDRIGELEKLGFTWELRNVESKNPERNGLRLWNLDGLEPLRVEA